jgi:hypothetical protein
MLLPQEAKYAIIAPCWRPFPVISSDYLKSPRAVRRRRCFLPTMSTPVNPPLVLSDRPLNKKLIGDLQSIDSDVSMKLDGTLKKDALLRAIQRHIKENPELADNSHLLPLFAHCCSPKNDVKTSAAKAAEEEVEGKKLQPAATG